MVMSGSVRFGYESWVEFRSGMVWMKLVKTSVRCSVLRRGKVWSGLVWSGLKQ